MSGLAIIAGILYAGFRVFKIRGESEGTGKSIMSICLIVLAVALVWFCYLTFNAFFPGELP